MGSKRSRPCPSRFAWVACLASLAACSPPTSPPHDGSHALPDPPPGAGPSSGGEAPRPPAWPALPIDLPEGAVGRFGDPRLRHELGVSSIAFSPDGRSVSTADGHSVRVWDTARGDLVARFDLSASHPIGVRWLDAHRVRATSMRDVRDCDLEGPRTGSCAEWVSVSGRATTSSGSPSTTGRWR